MNNKYAMIIDGDNMMSCSLPYPIICPNCKNDFWIVNGVDDTIKLSQKCKCTNQLPPPPKHPAETTEPPATEPPATEPPATEPPATEPPATEPPKHRWI